MSRLSSFDLLCRGYFTSKVRCTLLVVPDFGDDPVIDLRKFSKFLSHTLVSFSSLDLVVYNFRRYDGRLYVRYALEGPAQDIYAFLKLPMVFMSWRKIKVEGL